MDEYFERFGGVRDYLHSIVDEARKEGYPQTILGRRRYLPDLTSDNRQRREGAERMALTRRSRARPPIDQGRDDQDRRRTAGIRPEVADAPPGA